MLLFQLEENVPAWCHRHGMPQGQSLTLEQVWRLSQLWYADRLSAEYAGRSASQAEEIFQQAGLTQSFWSF